MRWRLAWKMQIITAIFVVICLSVLFGFLAYRQQQRGLEALHQQASTIADEIIVVRQWLADHGGVWVREPKGSYATEENGFYLKVPAIVTSELSDYTEQAGGFKMHVTALKPLNPANAPDQFERSALEKFTSDVSDEMEQLERDSAGQRMFRYVRPLYTEERCLQCHAQHGYKVGDVRGALSLIIPAEDALAAIRTDMVFYLLLGLVTLIAILMANGLVIFRLVAAPLHQIEVATRSLAVGNLDTRVEINSGDELQVLGESLNSMAAQMRESYVSLERLSGENMALETERENLRKAMTRDALTSLYNYHYFQERLRAEIARARREGSTLSLLMADIDMFKRCNDTYGHLAGDKVLAGVAQVIKNAVRLSDIPARYGGEEFAIILPNTDTTAAALTAERMRMHMQATPFNVGGNLSVSVTISIGVASFPGHAENEEALVRVADELLYKAKKNGRNRVEVAPG